MTAADEALIDAAQRYGDELEPPRIISGFAARALPLGSVLVRVHDDGTLADEAVMKVPGGWWSIDAPVAEPLAGDLHFRVLHVPGGPAPVQSPLPSRPLWRGRSFLTGTRGSFADGAS